MMLRVLLVCIFAGILSYAQSCPHEDAGLKKFSDVYTGYDKTTDIVVTDSILLDVTELDVNTIDITGSGKLVFNQGHAITIKVKGIAIKDDASLIIGSESCRHQDGVRIILQGTRTADRSTLTGAGEKYISVTDQGTLHIYGKDKMAWTKLTQTIPEQAFGDHYLYWHKKTYDIYKNRWNNGLSLHVFDSSFNKKFYDVFDLSRDSSAEEMENANKMIDELDGIADGDIVAVSVYQYMLQQADTDLSGLFDKIENIAGMESGSLLLRGGDVYDAFSLVFVKGEGLYNQQLEPCYEYQAPGLATASLTYQGHRIVAESSVYYKRGYISKTDFRIHTEATAHPEIQLVNDISSWQAGDRILITSTDFSWFHAEVRTIREVTGTNTLQLSDHLKFRHFGEIENGVDMRAEVALLSRNIKIEGEMSRDCPPSNENCDVLPFDTYGGHIKVIHNFASVVIDGAELENMGQRTDMGFYPIHFHMCLDVTGRDAIVRRNSIHHSLSRAVTVHGTYGTSAEQPGVQVIENVAYLIRGHAYFLEDGIERATILKGNLAASILTVPDDFTSDNVLATAYWITTPEVVVIGNVAAGGPGFGYWYIFPDEPVGPSKGHVYKKFEAKHTPMYTCDNNVAHSQFRGGMFYDKVLFDHMGKTGGVGRYRPVTNPLDYNSTPVRVQIVRFTAYKNYVINFWLRGGEVEIIQFSSAESKNGLQFGRGAPQPQSIRKSVFVGKSDKNGEDDLYPDTYKAKYFQRRIGLSYYDGPVYFESIWFTNFQNGPNMSYVAGALGFEHANKFSSSAISSAKDIRFSFQDPTEGNRVFDGNLDDEKFGFGNEDGDESKIFVDLDGSVTRCPGSAASTNDLRVVKPEKFVLTENCEYRENWKMAMCDEVYAKVIFLTRKSFAGANTVAAAQGRRIPFDDIRDVANEDFDSGASKTQPEYLMVLGNDRFYYEHQYVNDFPQEMELRANGIVKDFPVIVGFCLPEGTTRDEMTIIMATPNNNMYDNDKVIAVNSMEEIHADTEMNKFFLDGRMMYVKLQTHIARIEDWDKFDNEKCAGAYCPFVRVVLKTMRKNTPCFTATEAEWSTDVYLPASVPRQTCQYPATGQPDDDWGAGDTMLTSRDGNWGEWSGWGDCCNAPGEITNRRRYRLCNNPPKFGDGADCAGEGERFEACTNSCPVDGVLTDWSSWSECTCTGRGAGTSGVRSLTRECTGTAHGGKYCSGYLEYISSCDGGCGGD